MTDRRATLSGAVGDEGLARLADVLWAVLGERSYVAVGSTSAVLTAALSTAGLTVVEPPSTENADVAGATAPTVAISLAACDGTDVASARRHVEACARSTDVAIVFAAVGGQLARSPLWWDALFDEAGFVARDVLRGRLWDDDGWSAAALTTLTLYVRRDHAELSTETSSLPRSALHPGVAVAGQRVVAAVAALASDMTDQPSTPATSVAMIRSAVDDQRQALHATREELAVVTASGLRDLEVLTRSAAEEVESARSAAEAARLDAIVARAGAESAETALSRAVEAAAARASAADREPPTTEPRGAPAPPARFAGRAVRAVVRRAERRALRTADRFAARPGIVGRASKRAAAVYRELDADPPDLFGPLFDARYYVTQVPARRRPITDPLDDYRRHGAREGLDPHPLFDADWYGQQHGFQGPAGGNPLEHFVTVGWLQGLDPHPLFDVRWYLARAPDVAVAGVNPLVHYLEFGWRERRDPHPLFDTGWYLDHYPDVEAAGVNPLVHFVVAGEREGRSPSDVFDRAWYLDHHPAAAASPLPSYRYYLEVGLPCGHHPSPWAESLARADVDDVERFAIS